MSARRRIVIALASVVAVLASLPAGAAAQSVSGCTQLAAFAPGAFGDPATIDNGFLPLVPGSQLVMEGEANRGGGAAPHRVTFTVTDLTKVIGGVRSRVVWDLDVNQGVVVESELAFWAQDDAGNVWNTGEYPEEYVDGAFFSAPSVWLGGLGDAVPGIHMAATPAISTTWHLQGSAPAVDFLDCARVRKLNQRTCVPVGCFEGVLRTEEYSPLDPRPRQLKYHAPGVGIVRVEAVNDPEGETLVLAERNTLGPEAMAAVRTEALRLDRHAYELNDLYRQTSPAEGPPDPQPAAPPESVPEPPVQAPRLEVAVERRSAGARLTARASRSAVRRALATRLRGWTVRRVTCRLAGERRATCTFAARRRGATLAGRGSVTLRATGGAVGYRLTSTISRTGCRPVSSRRCSRRVVWSR
jgi:hypothetical protein